jgi:hypothetical protein
VDGGEGLKGEEDIFGMDMVRCYAENLAIYGGIREGYMTWICMPFGQSRDMILKWSRQC